VTDRNLAGSWTILTGIVCYRRLFDFLYPPVKFGPLNFSTFSMGVVKLATCFRIM
jgi:hypothetical protein